MLGTLTGIGGGSARGVLLADVWCSALRALCRCGIIRRRHHRDRLRRDVVELSDDLNMKRAPSLSMVNDGIRKQSEACAALRRSGVRWRRFSVQFGGLAKVGSGSDYAASLCSGLALSGASPG